MSEMFQIPEDQRVSSEEILRDMSDRDLLVTFSNYNRELARLATEQGKMGEYIRELAKEIERRYGG
jgi:hypothetical protein